MSAQPSHVRVLAQTDPTANRLRAFGDDITTARTMIADLTRLAKHLDAEAKSLTEEGLTITIDFGPIGNAALAVARDLHAGHVFDRGRSDRG